MKCTEFENLVHDYVDGELKDKKALETHMETCNACRALYDETLELKTLLADLNEMPLPDDFEATLHEELLLAASDMKVVPFYKNRNFKTFTSIAAIAVVSLLAVKSVSLIPDFTGGNSNNENTMRMSAEYSDDDSNFAVTESESMDDAEMTSDAPMEAKAMDESADMAEESVAEDDQNVATTSIETVVPPIVMDGHKDVVLTFSESGAPHVAENIQYTLGKDTNFSELSDFIETYDIEDYIIGDGWTSFYIKDESFEAFTKTLSKVVDIKSEYMVDFSLGITEVYGSYTMKTNDLDTLKKDASNNETAIEEIEASLDILETQIEAINMYEGYKRVTITIEEE